MPQHRLKRVLKRENSMHSVVEWAEDRAKRITDLGSMWQAYKLGAFEGTGLPSGIEDKSSFETAVIDMLDFVHDAFILESITKTNQGDKLAPVGVATVSYDNNRMEPHVVWFPWATARNKLESTINFIAKQRKDKLVLIWSEKETTPFFTHVCKYGILKRVGKVIGFSAEGDAMLFQSRRAA